MGSTWEVSVWGEWWRPGELSYKTVYAGSSLFGAIRAFWKHRNDGTGCVTLHYRGGRP